MRPNRFIRILIWLEGNIPLRFFPKLWCWILEKLKLI